MGWLEISLLVRWLLGWILGLRLPALPVAAAAPAQAPSLLIPARNEAATLPHLLVALAQQTLAPLEVIVIDDHSDDATAFVAVETVPSLGVRVIQPPPCRQAGAARPGPCITAWRPAAASYWCSSMPTPNRSPSSWPTWWRRRPAGAG